MYFQPVTYSVLEGDGMVKVEVVLEGESDIDVIVTITSRDGSATSCHDNYTL